MYLKKPITANTPATNKLKDHMRKHITFIKIKLAKVTADTITEQEEEIINSFSDIIDRLWSIDQGILIMPWKDDSTCKPLQQNSNRIKNKDQLSIYVDRLWMENNRNPFCRILIQHDSNKYDTFNDEKIQQWLTDKQLSLSIDRIQAQRLCHKQAT